MRTQRHLGNSFNNCGRYRYGRGRRFYGWRESTPDSLAGVIQTNEQNKDLELKYIGPCRCGRGPHAFYRNAKGEWVHTSEIKNNNS